MSKSDIYKIKNVVGVGDTKQASCCEMRNVIIGNRSYWGKTCWDPSGVPVVDLVSPVPKPGAWQQHVTVDAFHSFTLCL